MFFFFNFFIKLIFFKLNALHSCNVEFNANSEEELLFLYSTV